MNCVVLNWSISVPEEPLVSASAANAAIEKDVWEMQNVVRSLDAYIEWRYSTTSHPGSAISNWAVEVVGHVVRSQSGVSEERTACERRKRRHCRKASVQCNELVMFVTIEKPEDKGENQNCIGIVLNLVDRSDKIVGGMTERAVTTRIVWSMPEAQRGDAKDTKSVRDVPWQQISAETAEGPCMLLRVVR